MELQSEISKKFLANSLVELLKFKNYDEITVQDIVDKAKLSRMAYYRNFDSIDDILKYYVDKITDDFVYDAYNKYDSRTFKEYIIMLFDHLYQYRDLGIVLLKANKLYFMQEEFEKLFIAKSFNNKDNYRSNFIAGGLYNIYYHWLINGCRDTPKDMTHMFINFIKYI